jgi:hypothetical protein
MIICQWPLRQLTSSSAPALNTAALALARERDLRRAGRWRPFSRVCYTA